MHQAVGAIHRKFVRVMVVKREAHSGLCRLQNKMSSYIKTATAHRWSKGQAAFFVLSR